MSAHPERHDVMARHDAPDFCHEKGSYRARFADRDEEVEQALRLRYEVFNLELGEGLDSSVATGLDRDRFDTQCHHLIVEHVPTGEVVGTYRMQTSTMAEEGEGFYTAQEYDLSSFASVLPESVEVGRAAIAREHRHGAVLLLLWRGLAAYTLSLHKRFLFGCCSLTSQDRAVAARASEYLLRRGYMHPELRAEPTASFDPREQDESRDGWEATELPVLFRTYLRYGALVCSRPALDREFKTIDFLTLVDLTRLDPATILRRLAVDMTTGR